MKTPQDLEAGLTKVYFKGVFAGDSGEGKTHLAGTFPKTCFATTLPGELDTVLNKPSLRKNLVGWEEFIPTSDETAYQVVLRLEKFLDEEVRPMAKKGEIETFVLDGITSLAQYFWLAIKETLKDNYKSRSGAFDSLKAYGGLKDMLYTFLLKRVLTLPCNVVINAHMMVEDDETLEKKKQAGVPFNLAVLGSIRDVLPAMVSYCFYLSKEYDIKNKRYDYLVRTNKGAGKKAKSRLALPSVIRNVDYDSIMGVIRTATLKEELKEK